jgi:hypothetical protein
MLNLFPLLLAGQAMDVPIAVQVPLAVKSLSYAKNLPEKLKDGRLVVGICYQESNRRSYMQMQELSTAFGKEQSGMVIRVQMIPLDDLGQPLMPVQWQNLSCVYMTALRSSNPNLILDRSRNQGVISFSTEPNAALSHVTMAFELVGGRAKFAINLANSEKERCEFSSQLLKLAKIY